MKEENTITLIETTPEIAVSILETGKYKIYVRNKQVKWINLNNGTLYAECNQNGLMYNVEDVKIFIAMPKNA